MALTTRGSLAQIAVVEKWDKTFGGEADELLSSMIATPDGGYVLAGHTLSGAGGDLTTGSDPGVESCWLVKIRADGSKVWDRTYKSGGSLLKPVVIATSDGGFLIGGTLDGGVASHYRSEDAKGSRDYWVLKLDGNGNKEWDRTLGGSNIDDFKTLALAPDGGYLVGGVSWSGVSGDKTSGLRGGVDYWVVKLDNKGKTVWDKTFGGAGSDEPGSITPIPGGGYLLGGSSASNVGGEKSEPVKGWRGMSDFWIVKIDEDGNRIWDRTIGGTGSDFFASLRLLPSGEMLLGGTSNSLKGEDKSEDSPGNYQNGEPGNDYWVIKLSANGDKLWDKTIAGDNSDNLISLDLTADGGILLSGRSYSGASFDKMELNRGDFDYWVVQLNPQGVKMWEKAFGGPKKDFATAALVTPDGGFLVGGYSNSSKGGEKSENARYGYGLHDMWVVKANVTGLISTLVPVTKVWDRRFGGSQSEIMSSMVMTHEGGFMLGGSSPSPVSGDKTSFIQDRDIWIVKTDRSGNKIWDKTFGTGTHDDLTTIVKTPDGGYLLGGTSSGPAGSGNKTAPYRGFTHFWMIKIDGDGNKIWENSYGPCTLKSLIMTPDGGYLLGGSAYRGVEYDKTDPGKGGFDYWIVKTDSKGVKQWDRTFGGSGEEELRAIVPTVDGGFLLGGSSNSMAGLDKSQSSNKWDLWLVKLTADGNKVWDRTFYAEGDNKLTALTATSDGNFLLGGTKPFDNSDSQDYWVLKVNENGNTVWDKTFGGPSFDNLGSIIETSDGRYLIGGRSESQGHRDKTEAKKAYIASNFWVLMLDASGKKQWDKTLGSDGGQNLSCMLELPNKNFLLGGVSHSIVGGDITQDGRGFDDFWIVEISEDYKSVTGTPDFDIQSTSQLIVYPNPSRGEFHVRLADPTGRAGAVTLVLYDEVGRMVLTQKASGALLCEGVGINARGLGRGMYYLKVIGLDETMTKKVLIN
ncbi:T9SS type A sorting domain-containing protein [Rufibacter sp. DG15C]|uniref:T9SS type A sorting domain-containing protein n=1 Tax=Rufibacter sp. DG15C TaxID=1379909 RepID=UPI0018D3BB14|nr:T9SS type A sorting domain-containing protein [Rufibacter sp. DG15C]